MAVKRLMVAVVAVGLTALTSSPVGATTTPPTVPDQEAASSTSLVLSWVPGDKPEQPWDAQIANTVNDLERWMPEAVPVAFEVAWTPLGDGVFAAHPQRTDPVPDCGTGSPVPYEAVHAIAAFYCAGSDAVIYDDGDDSLFALVSRQLGDAGLSVAIAHEYGHAVQARLGVLGEVPTVVTEQQADCIAGAWWGRAVAGEAGVVVFDADMAAALRVLVLVADAPATDPESAGDHGLAFDRIGAFEAGIAGGLARCAELIDAPLPLTPNVYTSQEAATGDDLPLGEALAAISAELNEFWATVVPNGAGGIPIGSIPLRVVDGAPIESCASEFPFNPPRTAIYCGETGEVLVTAAAAEQLWAQSGDFAVAYLVADAYGDAGLRALGVGDDGAVDFDDRQLMIDCTIGAWAGTITPGQTTKAPATGPALAVGTGDLDELVAGMLIVVNSQNQDLYFTNLIGTPFAKTSSMRAGLTDGITACALPG